ncbi:hypothetical protein ANO11243_009690 [Dothideomycetidae sp. 11243]|nr:hypothetical protein ANO11243_009690 [fungal sp. No.11243]
MTSLHYRPDAVIDESRRMPKIESAANRLLRHLVVDHLVPMDTCVSIRDGDLKSHALRISANPRSPTLLATSSSKMMAQFCQRLTGWRASDGVRKVLPPSLAAYDYDVDLERESEYPSVCRGPTLPDGARYAAAFDDAFCFLGYMSNSFLWQGQRSLLPHCEAMRQACEFDLDWVIDNSLWNGIYDDEGGLEWQAYSYLNEPKPDLCAPGGCIIGSGWLTEPIPDGAVLRGELWVLFLILIRLEDLPPPCYVLNFTDTHARVICGEMTDTPAGPHINVTVCYNEPICSDNKGNIDQRVWKDMLCWAAFPMPPTRERGRRDEPLTEQQLAQLSDGSATEPNTPAGSDIAASVKTSFNSNIAPDEITAA